MVGLPREEDSAPRAGRRRRVLVASLILVAAVLAAGLGWRAYSERLAWSSVSTAIGDYRRLPLPDGSQLELNTATEVRYRLSDSVREVKVIAGEARFRVAHDGTWPFVVIAGDTVVRAVGTEFTVRLYENGKVDVLVAKGVVAVSHLAHQSVLGELLQPRIVPTVGGTPVEEGTMATDVGGRFAMVEMSQKKIEAHEAWRYNMLIFNDTPLTGIVEQFNRFNRRKLEIADPEIGNVVVSGQYQPRDVEGFLEQLNTVLEIRVGERRNAYGDVVALRIRVADPGKKPAVTPKVATTPKAAIPQGR
jgi:transmembrane sensor